MDKKAYYRFADIGMFIISFAIIAVAIGIGIFLFYSHHVDIREKDANVLSDKLVRVIVEDGRLNLDLLREDFNLLQEASINNLVINTGNYYFKVEVFENGGLVKDFIAGTKSFDVECILTGDKLPKRHEESFFLDNYEVKILTCSNQFGVRK